MKTYNNLILKNENLKISEFLSPKYERDNIKLGLSRIKKALQELGNPCENIPAIQIIGTNGKGSIAAYLESILFEAKKNFGVTTSPHLLDVCERIRVNKKNITLKAFDKGLLVVPAGGNVVRIVPPLVISRREINILLNKLNSIFEEL